MRKNLRRAIALGVLASFALLLAVPALASGDDALQNRQQLQLRGKGDDISQVRTQTRNQVRLKTGENEDPSTTKLTANQDRDRARDGERDQDRDRDRIRDCVDGLCQRLAWAWEWVRH